MVSTPTSATAISTKTTVRVGIWWSRRASTLVPAEVGAALGAADCVVYSPTGAAAICSRSALAKSLQLLERSSGFLAKAVDNAPSKASQIRAVIAELGNGGVKVLADDGQLVRMLIRRRTGEQVKSGSGQGILIGAPFQLQPRQLLWGGVRNRSHGGVGGNKPTGVSQFARNSE